MDEADRKLYEAQCYDLRIQLKQWEGKWASSNGGKKPSREDIKNNSDIAAKYKKYNRLRDTLSGKPPPPAKRLTADRESGEHGSKTKRRPGAELLGTTPAKRLKFAQTPSNDRTADMAVTPSISRKLFSPAVPTSIGPTPQRDGKVLGLFDLINQELTNAAAQTPSKATGGDCRLLATPIKGLSDLEEENEKLGKTPMSSGRRNYLNMFMTPVKPKDAPKLEDEDDKLDGIAKMFQTPEFLKRHQPMPMAGKYKSPSAIRLPRKPVGRTLSSMVASLRQMEDEKLDEEMELMREMEAEASGQAKPPEQPAASKALGRDASKDISPKPEPKSVAVEEEISEEILVKDSRTLLGGFDDEGAYDSPVEEQQLDRGRPLRLFKKKGQKRTTRKVNMRPTRTKRPSKSLAEDSSSEEDQEAGDMVPETQYHVSKENIDPTSNAKDFVGEESGSDFEDLTGGAEAEEEAEGISKPRGRGRPPKSTSTKNSKAAAKGKKERKDKEGEDEGKAKRAVRKVNELAHANFRALKLRNKGGKGGPGYGSRFRRRR